MFFEKSGRDNSEILKELVEALGSKEDAQKELWGFGDENGSSEGWSERQQKEHYELVLKVNDCSRKILRLVEEARTNNGWKAEEEEG